VIHHSTGKAMTTQQFAKTHTFAEKLGYPSRATTFGGSPNDYLYYCPNILEANVCRYMINNIAFLKLEARLSVMPFEDFFGLPRLHTLEGRHTFFCVALALRILRRLIYALFFVTHMGLY
jgi:hypothetical protein